MENEEGEAAEVVRQDLEAEFEGEGGEGGWHWVL